MGRHPGLCLHSIAPSWGSESQHLGPPHWASPGPRGAWLTGMGRRQKPAASIGLSELSLLGADSHQMELRASQPLDVRGFAAWPGAALVSRRPAGSSGRDLNRAAVCCQLAWGGLRAVPERRRNEGGRGTGRGPAEGEPLGAAGERPNGSRYGLEGEGCRFPCGELVCWCLARGLVMGPSGSEALGLLRGAFWGVPRSPESAAACQETVHDGT
ncbi:hypothetical protein NDU88_010935 [Pleurodeles waltl]|uniref:Uncharacterized protein n=1 Tax=Pleurodeles waltl TaxID=8319 RepID=A0AAV7QX66_PLEWA|nr:hypothetical protein NDU88_010935 [Pleurodeles waltl]